MKNTLWQRISPHVIAIAIFFIVSCFYCLPVFQGQVVEQHDVVGWKGMAQQSFEYKETHGHFPLWSNSVFSGMPAFQIALESQYDVTLAWLSHVITLFLPSPASLFFLACVGFYILAMTLRLKNWIGIFGSLGYAFASYSAIIVAAGHTTKFASMGYAPAVIAGLVLLSQRKYWLGFITTLTFSTLLFYQNHLQIVYYTLLIAVCVGIAFAIETIRKKDYLHLGKSAGLALAGALLGVASYAVMLLPTYDYSKETMRGGHSELTLGQDKENKSSGGLDKDYAFNWSYGIKETLTGIVPRILGGGTPTVVQGQYVNELSSAGGHTKEALMERTGMGEEQATQFVSQFPAYWGPQPSPVQPVYFGAAMIAAFLFGLVYYKGWHKGWIIAATLLGIFMAWGKHFSAFNYFLFDYLPLYNKFRAPSMALVIPQLTIPLLAALGLQSFFYGDEVVENFRKKFKTAIYAVGAVAIVLVALYFLQDYKGTNDNAIRESLAGSMLQQMTQGKQATPDMEQQAQGFGTAIISGIKADRKSLYGGDLLRSLIFMALVVGILYFAWKKKIGSTVAMAALALVSFVDLIGISSRYFSADHFIPEEELLSSLTATPADEMIKQDTGYYRVFDQTDPNGPFNSSRASYHHNAVGGYHPAKLAIYDDIIKHQLAKGNLQVFNMLNTKYFIASNPQNGQPMAQMNPEAMGPAWLVKSIHYVNSADEEMLALDSINLRDVAVIDNREKQKVTSEPIYDSAGIIQLVKNDNDIIHYNFNAATNQFAVFSEVYYSEGWKAFIDGKEAPIAKVNYVLRGLSIPAGKHQIEFRFEPASYKTGNLISLIVGVLSILLVAYGLWREYRIFKNKDQHRESPVDHG